MWISCQFIDVSFILDKDESRIHTGPKSTEEGEDGCFVDRQYEYFSSGVSHHHGFLSYRSGEYVDSVAKEGMTLPLRISERGMRN
jgi:hypothetical protein